MICDNTEYNVKLQTQNNADLSDNCWCSTDEALIHTKILDGYIDNSFGLVSLSDVRTASEVSVFPNTFADRLQV